MNVSHHSSARKSQIAFLRQLTRVAATEHTDRPWAWRLSYALMLHCFDRLLAMPPTELRHWTRGEGLPLFEAAMRHWARVAGVYLDTHWLRGLESLRRWGAAPFLRRKLVRWVRRRPRHRDWPDAWMRAKVLWRLWQTTSEWKVLAELSQPSPALAIDTSIETEDANPWFLRATLKENLLFHNPERYSEQRIWQALEAAGLFHKVYSRKLLNAPLRETDWTLDELNTLGLLRTSLWEAELQDARLFFREKKPATNPIANH